MMEPFRLESSEGDLSTHTRFEVDAFPLMCGDASEVSEAVGTRNHSRESR